MKTTTVLAVSLLLSYVAPAYADTFGSGANTFDIEFVTIGNPGNAADTTAHARTRPVRCRTLPHRQV